MTRAVFFDLDGTLTNPFTGITRCIRYALDTLEVDAPTPEDLRWCIGPPLIDSLSTLVGNSLAPQALALYRERFSEIGWRENRVYDGVPAMLHQVAAMDIDLYIATSKPRVYAERILEHFELAEYFGAIYGPDLHGNLNRKEDLLAYALDEIGGGLPATMVGDRHHDVRGALANNMTAIGVSYGFGSIDELTEAGAAQVLHSPAEITAWFSQTD